jgi:nitrite reductase/ring-hydroxylating ferredoxin subunit
MVIMKVTERRGAMGTTDGQGFSPARRKMLRTAALAAGSLSLAGVLAAMLRRVRSRQSPEPVPLPADLPEGWSMAGAVIVHREGAGEVRAFSSRCTHLGCRIDRVLDGEAACPCHGSRFHPDGSVAQGPATRPLERARLEPDRASGGWIAHVPS